MDAEDLPQMQDAMAALLAKNPQQPRSESQIAQNIGLQLAHMELTSLPLPLRRRIRDIAARLQPDRVVEVGSGIGHLSAWLLDLWEREEQHPESYDLVEAGSRFGVILTRLLARYEAKGWAHVRVGRFEQLAAEALAWKAASSTSIDAAAEGSLGRPPLTPEADLIIVDIAGEGQVTCIRAALPLLSLGGILLTIEPAVPTGEPAVDDVEANAEVTAFQEWMDLIQELLTSHHLAFQPLTGGTLVALIRR